MKASIRSASMTMGAFDRGPTDLSPDFAGAGLGAAAGGPLPLRGAGAGALVWAISGDTAAPSATSTVRTSAALLMTCSSERERGSTSYGP